MDIPNLKRINISSEQALNVWLSKPSDQDSVMLVTNTKTSDVSRRQIRDALAAHGWSAGPRFTLNAHLLGHVIRKDI